MTLEEIQETGYSYEEIVNKRYGKAWIIPEKAALICELTDSYVPIERFKEIFEEMQAKVSDKKLKRFIFDKRNLRVFHQPSMEWYFVEWKKEMYELGISEHRKILPEGEDWFKQAVKAGRQLILDKYTDLVVKELDIQYCKSVEDSLK